MKKGLLVMIAVAAIGCAGVAPQKAISGEPKSPVEGFDIHVQAPHLMPNGEPGGPFHHYCKGISDKILQCLLFDSTDPKAKLVAVEYFVSKDLTRKLPAIQWYCPDPVRFSTDSPKFLRYKLVPPSPAEAISPAAKRSSNARVTSAALP